MQPLSEIKIAKVGKLLDDYIRECTLIEVQIELATIQDPRARESARIVIDNIRKRNNEW